MILQLVVVTVGFYCMRALALTTIGHIIARIWVYMTQWKWKFLTGRHSPAEEWDDSTIQHRTCAVDNAAMLSRILSRRRHVDRIYVLIEPRSDVLLLFAPALPPFFFLSLLFGNDHNTTNSLQINNTHILEESTTLTFSSSSSWGVEGNSVTVKWKKWKYFYWGICLHASSSSRKKNGSSLGIFLSSSFFPQGAKSGKEK